MRLDIGKIKTNVGKQGEKKVPSIKSFDEVSVQLKLNQSFVKMKFRKTVGKMVD